MRFLKKLRKRWQAWYRGAKHPPVVAERRNLLKVAIRQGVENPVGRARRGRM